MSALAMILTAAMAVPGDGPEKVSGEVELSPQPLDLRGIWKGRMKNYHGVRAKVHLSRGRLKVEDNTKPGEFVADVPVSFVDEGDGSCRQRLNDDQLYRGIYSQEGDRFILCFGDKYRPNEFKLAERQGLIILHCVKSRK